MSSDNSEILKRLQEVELRLSKLEGAKSQTKVERKELSVAEFFLDKKPENDVQRTLVIGYYLENYGKMDSFNKKDLENGFRQAKEKPPGNINEDVNQNIRKGFMMTAREPKDNRTAWILTNGGEKLVEVGFGKPKQA